MTRTIPALALTAGLLAAAAGQASAAGWTDEPIPSSRESGALTAVDTAGGETWAFGRASNGTTPVDDVSATYRRDAAGWHEVPTPNVGALTDGDVVAPGDAWAVGVAAKGGGGVLHWDGTRWQESVPVPPPEGAPVPRGLTAFAADDVWIAGQTGRRGMVQHWDGTAWSEVPVPAVGGGASWSLDRIEGTGSGDLWAVGHTSSPDRGVVLRWDGAQWTQQPAPDGSGRPDDAERIDEVLPLGPDDVWVSGSSGPRSAPVPFTAHWDGARWTAVPPGEHTGPVTDLTAAGGEVLLFGADGTRPFAMRLEGGKWVEAEPAPGGAVHDSLGQDGGMLAVGSTGDGGAPPDPYAATYRQ